MRVLAWVLVWLVLLAAAGWYLWRELRRLWGRSRLLGDQLTDTGQLLTAMELVVAERSGAAREAVAQEPAPELAVFRSPLELAAERQRLLADQRAARAARRQARLPGWARPATRAEQGRAEADGG